MANYCKQCGTAIFGEDPKDLDGQLTAEQVADGFVVYDLCEGCGSIAVNHLGECVSSDCDRPDHYGYATLVK